MEIYTTKSDNRIVSLSRGAKTDPKDGCSYCSVKYEINGRTREGSIYDPSHPDSEKVHDWVDFSIYNALVDRALSTSQINDVLRELWDGPEGEVLYVMAR